METKVNLAKPRLNIFRNGAFRLKSLKIMNELKNKMCD